MASLPVLVASCKSNDISQANNGAGVIGPEGGELTGPDGVTVLFPAGAVPNPTTFTITAVSNPAPFPNGATLEGPAVYSLQPHGFLFSGAVTVKLPVNPGVTSGTVEHASCNASDACQGWDPDGVPGVTFENGAAIFTTPTFSLYAVISDVSNATDSGSMPMGALCSASTVSAAACFPMSNLTCMGIGTNTCSCMNNEGPACQGMEGGSAPCEFTWSCDGNGSMEKCGWDAIGGDASTGSNGGSNQNCMTICASEDSAATEMASMTGCGKSTAP